MRKDFSPDLAQLLQRQNDVASRMQLLRGGVSVEAVRWNQGRAWQVVLPNVFLLSRSTMTPRQRQIAGLLWAGEGSVLGRATGAEAHGVRSASSGQRVEMLVGPTRTTRSVGFARARRTTIEDPNVVSRGVIRLSSAPRAIVDAALDSACLTTRTAILVEAVQRRIVTMDALAESAFRLRARDRVRVDPALEAAASGAWSAPEAELLDLLATSAILPEAWPNPLLEDQHELPLTTPDAWFDDVGFAVMVHSHQYHSGSLWDATVSKDGELTAYGIVVAGVTPKGIRDDPAAVLRRIERTYLAAAQRSRPPVLATPRALVGLLRRPR